MTMDDRDAEILCQAVHLFITTGEPVSSKALCRVNAEGLSSATLRSVMSRLEEQGYFDQPHASAGRVPTDSGYRFYVRTLVASRDTDSEGNNHRPLVLTDRQRITEAFSRQGDGVAALMKTTSRLLADMSGTVSFVVGPDFQYSPLRHIDFVRLAPRRLLVVLVSETGQVIHRLVELEKDLTAEDLSQCARYLEDEFRSFTLSEAREILVSRMRTIEAIVNRLVRNALTIASEAFSQELATAEIRFDGTSRLFSKPEFRSNVERAQSLLATLEERQRLIGLLGACVNENGLQVLIGSESQVPAFEGISVVGANFGAGDHTLGAIGIMGPTRMEYARVISLVDYTAWSLSEAMSQTGSHMQN